MRRRADVHQSRGPIGPAEFPSVSFDPTIKKVGDVELMGHYVYDDQGGKDSG